MVGVFVGLKLRLLRNSLNGGQGALLALGGLAGLVLALVNVLVAAAPFTGPDTTADLLAACYAAWLAGWLLAPIATGGDEVLRADYFALLPMRRATLATGLLAAGFVSVPAVVSLVTFAGMACFGLRFGAGAAIVGLLAAAPQSMIMVLLHRTMITGLGSVLTSRRGKELGLVLVALTGLSGVGMHLALSTVGPALTDGRAPVLAAVVHWLPSGWGVHAVLAAGTGDWGRAMSLLVGLYALVAAMLAGWAWLLSRGVARPAVHRTVRARRARTTRLAATPIRAVVAKELRMWWRDMRRRIALFGGVVMAAAFALMPSISSDSTGPAAYVALYVTAFVCINCCNLYGLDGGAMWHTIVTPGAIRVDVRGRQLTWLLLVGPFTLALAAVLPGVTGTPAAYPWLIAVLPAVLGAASGVVVLVSVVAAYPVPRTSNPFATNSNAGCTQMLMAFAMLGVLALAAVPGCAIELAAAMTGIHALHWAAAGVSVITGALFAWWCGRQAIRRLTERGPEILQTVNNQG